MRERPRRSQKVRHYQFTKQKDLGESIIYSFARCVAGQSTDMIVTYSLITYLLISILSSSLKSRRRRTKVAQTSLPYTQQPAWRPRFSISLKGSPHFNLQSIPSPAISSPLARSEETTIKMKATSAVITIITTATCPHCLRLKHHLQNNISLTPLSTPYSEVQIDDSRIQKIQLLKKYTKGGASTVPQCFLGRHNLGGADDTIAMIQAIVSNIEADESISETLESRMLSSLSPDAYEEACTPFPLDEFMSVGSGDFEDSSAVTIDAAFVEENTKPKIGSSTPKSLKSKVFSNASRKINDSHSPIGLDYYDPATANSVVTALHQLVSTIIITHTDPATGNVDYLAAASDPNFTDIFVPATSLLKRIDLFSLKPEEKIPIVLNVYNLMCKHSFIHLGIPFKALQRLQYFDYGLYLFNGGGVALSLNCLEVSEKGACLTAIICT